MNKTQSKILTKIQNVLESDRTVRDELLAKWIRDVIVKSDLSETDKQVTEISLDK